MRAVIQREKSSSVSVGKKVVGEIGHGLLVLLGISKTDKADDAKYLGDKIVNLRIFEDENNKTMVIIRFRYFLYCSLLLPQSVPRYT